MAPLLIIVCDAPWNASGKSSVSQLATTHAAPGPEQHSIHCQSAMIATYSWLTDCSGSMLETRLAALLKKLESSSAARAGGSQSRLKPLRAAVAASARGAAQGAKQARSSRTGGSSAAGREYGGADDGQPSTSGRDRYTPMHTDQWWKMRKLMWTSCANTAIQGI